jgi:hypothetical protein
VTSSPPPPAAHLFVMTVQVLVRVVDLPMDRLLIVQHLPDDRQRLGDVDGTGAEGRPRHREGLFLWKKRDKRKSWRGRNNHTRGAFRIRF